MSRREKLRQKLRNQPANCNMQDVQTLLQRFGFELVRTHGSHRIFVYDDGELFEQIVVPLHGRKVKKIYIQKVTALLDALFPHDEEADEDNDGKEH